MIHPFSGRFLCSVNIILDFILTALIIRRTIRLAEAALATASRLRPEAGETRLARAWNLYVGYRDYDAALGELKLAREVLPNDPQIFQLTSLSSNGGRDAGKINT